MSLLPVDRKAWETVSKGRVLAGGDTHHLDLEQGLIAVVQKVARLATVDADDTQQQMTAQSESHGGLVGINDIFHILLEVGLQHIGLGQFALEIRSDPDAGQRPGLLQQRLGIEHCDSDSDETGELRFGGMGARSRKGAGVFQTDGVL